MLRRVLLRFPRRTRPTLFHHLRYEVLKTPAGAVMQLVSLIAKMALSASDTVVGILQAAAPAGQLSGIIWGAWIARGAKVPFVCYPELFSACLLFSIFFIRSEWAFAVIICLNALIASSIHPAKMGIMRLNYPPQRRGSIFALSWGFSTLGISILAFGAGKLLDFRSDYYRYLFPLSAMFSILAALEFRKIRVTGETNRGLGIASEMNLKKMLAILIRDKRFRRYQYSVFFFGLSNIVTLAVLPIYLPERFGVSYASGSLVLATVPLVLMVLGLPLWGHLVDRYNPLLMRGISNLFMLCFPLVLWLCPDLFWIAIGSGIRGLFQGGSGLIWSLGTNYFARRSEVAAYTALHQFLTGIRGIGGPFLGLYLMRQPGIGPVRTFLIAFCIGVVGVGFLFLEVWREWKIGKLRSFSEAEEDMASGEERESTKLP